MESQTAVQAKPLDEWCEDDGSVLWWRFPIQEPPWVGTPLDSDWPIEDDGDEIPYYKHWTPFVLPANPDGDGNPPPEVHERDNEVLLDLLLLVDDYKISVDDVAALTDEGYEAVLAWASATYLKAGDNDDVEVPPRPAWIDSIDPNNSGKPRDWNTAPRSPTDSGGTG